MRGSKARQLRKMAGVNKDRTYFIDNFKERKVKVDKRPLEIDPLTGEFVQVEFTYYTCTRYADHTRRFYCNLKKLLKNQPLPSI